MTANATAKPTPAVNCGVQAWTDSEAIAERTATDERQRIAPLQPRIRKLGGRVHPGVLLKPLASKGTLSCWGEAAGGAPRWPDAVVRGGAFLIPEARQRYFDLVSFDAASTCNMVAIAGPTQTMKLNVMVQDKLGRINCPIPILHGSEDFIVADAPGLLHQLIPNAGLVIIADSGHCRFIEQSEEFTAALGRFVTRPLSRDKVIRT